jgi:hypothetical protein
MGKHEASPNSETTETATPQGQNATASAVPHGKGPGEGFSDQSRDRIVSSK